MRGAPTVRGLERMSTKESLVLLGRIAGAHGIRGEVIIHSYAEVPEDIGAYGALTARDGQRTFHIEWARASSKGVVARLKGVRDRNAAEALKGTELYVRRNQLPEPEAGEFYVNDLIGMEAVDTNGQKIGTVIAAPDFGAGPLLEIRKPQSTQTDLIPFTDAYVPEVDLAGRRVVVRPLAFAEDDNAEAGEE